MKEVKMPSLLEMLKAGVHFGHQTSNWHPKMAPYIFGERSGVHIINLEETQKKLKEAMYFLSRIAKSGGVVLFVGTKSQAKDIIKKYAEECGMPYVIERWVGGTLTNFGNISRLIKKFKDLKVKQTEENKYTKKELLGFSREVEKLDELIGGISTMQKVPDAIFIVDIKNEKTALREAHKREVPIVAMCDTNINPTDIDYVIPSNDDARKSIEMIVGLVSEIIKENKSAFAPKDVELRRDKQEKSVNDNKIKEEKKVKEEKKENKKVEDKPASA